jgi:hypothetical protein
MKTDPQRYMTVLGLAARLAPAVPDASAARDRRRIESGVRASFALRAAEWATHLRTHTSIGQHDRAI